LREAGSAPALPACFFADCAEKAVAHIADEVLAMLTLPLAFLFSLFACFTKLRAAPDALA
jgi:hypothetical protein